MCLASSALANDSSGRGNFKSANTLPLPTVARLSVVFLATARTPFHVMLVRQLQPFSYQRYLLFRRLDHSLGLLLKRMQDINCILESHCVDRTKRITVIVGDNLEYRCATKTSKRFCALVLVPHLSQMQSEPHLLLYVLRKGTQVVKARPNPNGGFPRKRHLTNMPKWAYSVKLKYVAEGTVVPIHCSAGGDRSRHSTGLLRRFAPRNDVRGAGYATQQRVAPSRRRHHAVLTGNQRAEEGVLNCGRYQPASGRSAC